MGLVELVGMPLSRKLVSGEQGRGSGTRGTIVPMVAEPPRPWLLANTTLTTLFAYISTY